MLNFWSCTTEFWKTSHQPSITHWGKSINSTLKLRQSSAGFCWSNWWIHAPLKSNSWPLLFQPLQIRISSQTTLLRNFWGVISCDNHPKPQTANKKYALSEIWPPQPPPSKEQKSLHPWWKWIKHYPTFQIGKDRLPTIIMKVKDGSLQQ